MLKRKIGIIAVHGVGDHRPGEMSAALAEQLQTFYPEDYRLFETSPIQIPVDTTELPIQSSKENQEAAVSKYLPTGADSRLRAHLTEDPNADYCDLKFTATLLAGGEQYRSTYSSSRLSKVCEQDETQTRIDIHEMFWADLSHGGVTGGFSVLSQLMQLFLHMASLGRTALASLLATMSKAERADSNIPCLYATSALGYWILAVPILMGNILFLIFGCLLLSLLIPDQSDIAAFGASLASGIILAAAVSKVVAARLQSVNPPAWILRGGLVGAWAAGIGTTGVGMIVPWEQIVHPKTVIFFLASALLLVAATVLMGRYELSRPGAKRWWAWLLVLLGSWAVASAFILHRMKPASLDLVSWFEFIVEGCFGLLVLTWGMLYLVNLYLFIVCILARRELPQRGAAVTQSINTSLLAASLPAPLFISVILALWAGFTGTLARSNIKAMDMKVPSLFLDNNDTVLRRMEQLIDLSASPAALPYLIFLSAAFACALVGLTPSIVAEVFPPKLPPKIAESRGLGSWLDAGFRLLHIGGRVALVGFFIILPVGVVSQYILPSHTKFSLGVAIGGTTLLFLAATKLFSGAMLGNVSRFFGRLRVVVDTAIDVDNWLRERPESHTPRLHIMARYVSLLRHMAAQDYARIIVVAHSQGSVITLDLFRFLKAHNPKFMDRLGYPCLLTLGCPLRQLYAARFPALYGWINDATAEQAGLASWSNGYGSGDYVGRNLWGGGSAQSRWTPGHILGQSEFCVGPLAHTHYFDNHAPDVAAALAELIDRT